MWLSCGLFCLTLIPHYTCDRRLSVWLGQLLTLVTPMTPEIHRLLFLHRCLLSTSICVAASFCPCERQHILLCASGSNWLFFICGISFTFWGFFKSKTKLLLCAEKCITGNVVSLIGSLIFLALEQWLRIEKVPQASYLWGKICCLASWCPACCRLLSASPCLCWVKALWGRGCLWTKYLDKIKHDAI